MREIAEGRMHVNAQTCAMYAGRCAFQRAQLGHNGKTVGAFGIHGLHEFVQGRALVDAQACAMCAGGRAHQCAQKSPNVQPLAHKKNKRNS